MNGKELNIRAPCNRLGYGKIAQNLILPLQQLGIKINYFPIGQIEVDSNREDIKESIKIALKGQDDYNPQSSSLLIWHQHSLAERIGKGLHIGWPIFELDTFTPRELHHLRNCDKLFTCTSWAKNIIKKNKINIPTFVIPLGVDTTIFYPSEKDELSKNYPSEKTIFLNISKWEVRKGHDVLSQIFRKAFSEKDNVELWMICENPFYSYEENLNWQVKYYDVLGSQVRFISTINTQEELSFIINQVDCGIFPSRGEGFGLPILEIMACGKQIITTSYSGMTEFCNDQNAHLISIDSLESAFDGKWFFNQGNWAAIGKRQMDQCVEYLRKIHLTKQEKGAIMNIQGIETTKKFNWANSAWYIKNCIFK